MDRGGWVKRGVADHNVSHYPKSQMASSASESGLLKSRFSGLRSAHVTDERAKE